MTSTILTSTILRGLTVIAAAITASGTARAQADVQPTNSAPNPYHTVEGWAKLPDGRTWGSTSAVEIDKDGKTIWVAERCGTNSCAGSTLDPILHFDATGKVIKSFGGGMLISPHGIYVDADGNIWVTDCTCTNTGGGGGGRGRGAAGAGGTAGAAGATAGAAGAGGARGAGAAPPAAAAAAAIGHQVFKFSPDGKLLLTLGKPGGGADPEFFMQPNDVIVAPSGEIFVSQGHSGAADSRIYKFAKDGTFLKTIATKGAGPGQFNQPHALAFDSRGRLFVGDRGNNRIQIIDQDGRLLDTWYQFGRPSGIYIDAKDNIYVADSESGTIDPTRTAWKRGIRVGSTRDGKVTALIPDPNEAATGTSAAEGVAADAQGNIYGAEVGPKALKKYARNG